MKFNYHTHTKRCNHAQGDERAYVESAIENGFQVLGFSDHAPYNFPHPTFYSTFRMQREELEEYAENVRALAKEYEKDIRILCGFELEYYPDFHKEQMSFLSKVKPDFLIMGQHFIGNEINNLSTPHLNSDLGLSAYVSQVLAGLATGDFLYLAHPDLVGFHFSPQTVEQEYRRLCEGAKRMGIPLEINFLGLRTNRHYPNKIFFKIAAEVGNDVIFGWDAHSPEQLSDTASIQTAKEWASELGLHVIDKPIL